MFFKNFKSFTVLFACLSYVISFAQPNEIKIKFIGNCGLELTDGKSTLYVDFPYKSGAHHYMEYNDSEIDSVKPNAIFLFTHKHSDHFSNKILRQILKNKQGLTFGPWNIAELNKIGESIPDFSIQAFKTKHLYTLNHYSYLITWHGKKIYLSGDTESADTFLSMSNIDWAFVPAWIISDLIKKDKIEESRTIADQFAIYQFTILAHGILLILQEKKS